MEWLANLSVKWVLVGVGALVLGLTIVRLLMSERDNLGAWLIENLQVVLSVVVVVFLIIRPFLFQAFYIPSGSMEPTLLGPATGTGAGDRLLVNKLIYRVTNPKRGDIVVFHAPPEVSGGMELHGSSDPLDPTQGKEFIKRVMGEPGETISVAPPRITVDGKQVISLTNGGSYNNGSSIPGISIGSEVPRVADGGRSVQIPNYSDKPIRVRAVDSLQLRNTRYRLEVDGEVLLENPDGRITEIPDLADRFGTDPKVKARAFRVEADDPGGRDPHIVLVEGKTLDYRPGQVMIDGKAVEDFTPRSPDYGMAPVKLAADEYFMMGDNRNNSNDSHQWGPLKRRQMIGRAEIIFWPLNRFRLIEWWLLVAMVVLFGAYEFATRALRGHQTERLRQAREAAPSRT